MCVQSTGQVFDGPVDAAAVQAMAIWKINAVRIALNEDCWLGLNGANPSGSAYQQAVISFVNLLNQNNIYAIVDLHWNAPGQALATSQQVMADQDHAADFWTSVAGTFKGNNAVIFDLYNEPHDISWSCWKNGGACGGSFPIAGMQTLVNAVRAAGATNVVMLGGLAFANDLSQWLANEPADTLNPPQIAAAWHVYNFNACSNAGCWNQTIAPVAAQVPVITGEMGENDCASGFITPLMAFMDQQHINYIAQAWNVSSCGGFPSLISDYNGTPTNYGAGYKTHLLSFR